MFTSQSQPIDDQRILDWYDQIKAAGIIPKRLSELGYQIIVHCENSIEADRLIEFFPVDTAYWLSILINNKHYRRRYPDADMPIIAPTQVAIIAHRVESLSYEEKKQIFEETLYFLREDAKNPAIPNYYEILS